MNRDYTTTFISTECLAKNIDNNKYKIIDLREIEKYQESHIKGSIHIDNSVFIFHNEEGINELPNKNLLEKTLKEKGINNDDTLILVDDVFNLNCSLAAWTLNYYGFTKIKLLDGALARWEKEERPLTDEVIEYPPGKIELKQVNEEILIEKDEILLNINSKDILFVDNRTEYAISYDQQGGNIPGAIHYWYLEIFKECPDYFVLKNLEDIERELTKIGISKDKTIVVYCESAPQSALVYLVLKELNYPKVRLYLAGFNEWRIICSFF
ncbi:MAG: sulfurtransferase [Candidatus Thorarchaeota archaeon]